MSSSAYSKNPDLYDRAGRISLKALDMAKGMLERGVPLLEVAERTEAFIKEQGAEPAFPVNLSINEFAAHDTPAPDDTRLPEGLIKLDLGVHIEGHISDLAMTVDLTGEHGDMVETAQQCFEDALSIIKDGVKVRDIGGAIEKAAHKNGFNTVKNLGGHQIDIYRLHAGLFIPNYTNGDHVLHEGDVIAIEPFITPGKGWVVNDAYTQIYSAPPQKPRSPIARRIYQRLAPRMGLPFALRWLKDEPLWQLGIKHLNLHAHPRLREVDNAWVSQFERTVMVEKDAGRVIGTPG